LNGGQGDDKISGGQGDDRVHDPRDHNKIACGLGFDNLVTNNQSNVATNCEQVTRR
jgi:Ca2+-binding RTX toxin-like protein